MHRPHHIALTACFSQTGDDWCSCSCRKKKYHITPRQVSPSRWILTLILPFLYGLWRLKNLSQVLRQMSPCVELWGAHLEAKAVVPPNSFTALQHTYIFLLSCELLDQHCITRSCNSWMSILLFLPSSFCIECFPFISDETQCNFWSLKKKKKRIFKQYKTNWKQKCYTWGCCAQSDYCICKSHFKGLARVKVSFEGYTWAFRKDLSTIHK